MRRKIFRQKIIALELCKQHQRVEESEVSWQPEPIFHTLINTCVENLIVQKYFLRVRHEFLPSASFRILTATLRMIQWLIGLT